MCNETQSKFKGHATRPDTLTRQRKTLDACQIETQHSVCFQKHLGPATQHQTISANAGVKGQPEVIDG